VHERSDAEQALLGWRALDFEQAAAERGLVVTALRRFDEWDATPQGRAVAAQPLFTISASAMPRRARCRHWATTRPAGRPAGARPHTHPCRPRRRPCARGATAPT
jgi:hypothetical protein